MDKSNEMASSPKQTDIVQVDAEAQSVADPKPKRPPPPDGMSKNAWKREQKKAVWLEHREERNRFRKVKRKERKIEKRIHKQELTAGSGDGALAERNSSDALDTTKRGKNDKSPRADITIIIDCGFDDMMTEKERLSLSAQITRCYSENRRAVTPVHLKVSSLDKLLLERFDTTMKAQYKLWKGITFTHVEYEVPESEEERSRFIYLSSDSEETLTTLEDNMTYIVGGIVDKGRYKNLCLNKANSQRIKTAKLPISEYISISGRKVLTTNHVVEIMIKWVEYRDWKKAFEMVIPPRKQEGFESSKQKRKRESQERSENSSEATPSAEQEA